MSLANKRQRHDTDKTPGAHANSVKQGLGDRLVRVVDGLVGEPFLTEAESQAARDSLLPNKHERFLVAYMTPLLSERLMPSFTDNDVLVNSEEYAWIPQRAGFTTNYLAPDHFVAPHYLIKFREPYLNAPLIENGEYGTFPVMNAKKSIVAIGDAKKKLDSQAEGEFMRLLACASCSTETLFLRGFVYDCETCVLMTALSGAISQYTSVKWTTPGSRSLICDYFRGREFLWDEALRTACAALNVRVQRFSTRTHDNDGGKTCILGEGAVGRVFRVTREVEEGNAPQELALKVALGQEAGDELESECEVASNLAATLDDVIIRPIPQTLWSGVCGADAWRVSAFLLNLVGEPFHHPEDISDADGRLILETLSDLHDGGIVHGDARYKNVVRVSVNGRRQLRWIDRGRSRSGSSLLFAKEVASFFESMGDRYFDEGEAKRYAETTARKAWRSAEDRRQCARSLWVSRPLQL
jgi:hypothetical protein